MTHIFASLYVYSFVLAFYVGLAWLIYTLPWWVLGVAFALLALAAVAGIAGVRGPP